MPQRLNGYPSLAYLGVEPLSPPLSIEVNRAPTQQDKNYNIGTMWVVKNTTQLWILVSLARSIARWVLISGGSPGAITFPCDIGVAVESGGILNIFGDGSNIITTGSGNTVSIALNGSIATEYILDIGTATALAGVLGVHGGALIQTSAGGPNTIDISLTNGTNGQTPIGGVAPAWALFTSSDGSITITPGPNSLDIEATVVPGSQTFVEDVGSATPITGILHVVGGSNINTAGALDTVAFNLNNTVSHSGSLSTGTTLTAGSGLLVSSGGITSTGTTTLHSLGEGVMQTDASGIVSSTKGTDGQVLIGATGGSAAWNNMTSSTITITNGPNSIDLSFASPATNALQFQAYQNTTVSSTFVSAYSLGASAILVINFDTAGAFFPGNGAGSPATFTAPHTGKYFLSFNSVIEPDYTGNIVFEQLLSIITPARTYLKRDMAYHTNFESNNFSVIADMTAGDVATFTYQIIYRSGGPLTQILYGNGAATLYTFVSGYFII